MSKPSQSSNDLNALLNGEEIAPARKTGPKVAKKNDLQILQSILDSIPDAED